MKSTLLLVITVWISVNAIAQSDKDTLKSTLLKQLAENGCKCIDSIAVTNKTKDSINKEINRCIDDQAGAYQLGSKLMGIDILKEAIEDKDGKKQVNISINMDKNSKDYQKFYYEIERYLMENCIAVKDKVASNEKRGEKSISHNAEAIALYTKGQEEAKNENCKAAISYYKKALKIDPNFAFAWDNLGLCYRKLGNFDEAIDAYNKSLEIDPYGSMPLQNIAVAYAYKKEYIEAIAAYKRLAEINKNDPEVYYGIGNIYSMYLNDYENGLLYMCKAYNIYTQQKSPYRTDAEKVIQVIHSEMKKQGKETRFYEILKENNIKAN